jgi:uncharacterized membrane protein YkvA (DUF1232 family)
VTEVLILATSFGTRPAYGSRVLGLARRLQIVRLLWRNGHLAWRLVRDPRTPLIPKLILGASLLYVLSPLDIVPDVVPVLGQLDDVAALALGLELFFKYVPDWLRREHEAALGRTHAGGQIVDMPFRSGRS